MASSRVAMPWIAGALVAGVLAGGLPLWPMSYGEVAILTSPLPMWWAVAVSIAAVGVSYASPLGIVRSAVVVALGVPVAVALRVGGDPTTHTLWPLEVALALAIVILPALGGAYIGYRLQHLRARSHTIR